MCTDCNFILDDLVVVKPPVYAQPGSRCDDGGVVLHSNNEGTEEGSFTRSALSNVMLRWMPTIGHSRVRV